MANPVSVLWRGSAGGAPGEDPESEYKRRFLTGLLIILLPLSAVVGLVILPAWIAPTAPQTTATFQAAVGFTLALLGAFALNRYGQYRWAASLTVFSCLGAAFWASLDHVAMVQFVAIAVVVATALFSHRRAVAVGIGAVAAAPLLVLHPDYAWADLVFPTCFSATFTALLFMVRHHHMELEQRRRTELERSARWFSTTLRSIGDGVLTVDTEGFVTFMNPVASELTGWSPDEAKGVAVDEVFDIVNEYTGEPVENPVRKVLRQGTIVGLANHTILLSKDGSRRPIADSGAPILEPSGQLHGVVLVFRDMSTEAMLTGRLRRAERLESLGQLAGGVAHDFNNLLTVIGSSAQFALSATDEDSPVRADLQTLVKATDGAVSLTRQLLAFSRRQVMQPRVIRIDQAIREAQQLLHRLLRDNVRVVCELDPDLGCVRIDPTQFEQVMVNLTVNANDAMTEGGVLTISATRTWVEGSGDLQSGTYAKIQVSDTGCGMESASMSRIFEPFFTTKEGGHGTGLGLSTVHGIVRQSGGDIAVRSEVGQGTTFTVLLPFTDVAEDAIHPEPAEGASPLTMAAEAVKTIYLVEDDAMVRSLGVQILERLGYQVRAFGSGNEVLQHFDACKDAVDLLVTDVVMPGMSGPQVAEALRARLPDLPVIFVSGYANEVLAREGAASLDSTFLEKPFTPRSLAETIRGRLDAHDRP